MKQGNVMARIIARCLLLGALLFIAAFFAFKKYWFSCVFTLMLALMVLCEALYFLHPRFMVLHKVVDALLYDDFSLEFPVRNGRTESNSVKLYRKVKEDHRLSYSKEVVYHELLNTVSSGFLILKKEQEDRKIIFMNRYFKQLFDVPESSSWSYLRRFIPEFCKVLEEASFKELKTTVEIQLPDEERQTYVLRNSKTRIAFSEYDVIFLDSVQRVIDSTEKEAWINVMKVIAHEIINSLTPIYSLANSTKEYFEQGSLSEEDEEDIRLSLDTIMNRSRHLQMFVEQYRQLTMLPNPVKSDENLSELLRGIQQSFQSELNEKGIFFHTDVPGYLTVYVDRMQIEQVFINLIKNSIYALDGMPLKEIRIRTRHTESRLHIIFSDSGALIDEAIVPKIFLPFYTTRKDGAGIGLALSKNIMETHGGYLYYSHYGGEKQFVVVLKV